MSWAKSTPSQYPHYEASASILQVRGSPFGVIIIDTGVVELLEFNTKRWWSVAALPVQKQGFASTPLGDSVLVIGGFWQTQLAMEGVHAFTFGSSEWQSMPPLNTPRCYPAAVSLSLDNGEEAGKTTTIAVVLGGRTAAFEELKAVECFRDNGWHAMPSFSTPRMAPAAVVLPPHDESTVNPQIMLIGGYNGSEWVTSIEALEMNNDIINGGQTDGQWSSDSFPDMPIPVSFPQAVVIPSSNKKTTNGEPPATTIILVVGTSILQDNHEDTFTVIQSLNVNTKSWSMLLSRPKRRNAPREGCSIAYYKNVVYAIGGSDIDKKQPHNSKRDSKKVLQFKMDDTQQLLQEGIFDITSQAGGGRSVTSSRRNNHNNNNNHKSDQSRGTHPDSSDRSRTVPPAINVQNSGGSVIMDAESLYSAAYSHMFNENQSVKSMVSQLPTRPPEEEIATHRAQDMAYQDYLGVPGTYTGEIATATNKPHGKGQLQWETTGDVYDGEWKHGSRYGYGRMTYQLGDVFEGWFKHDVKEGRGTYQWRDGKQYEGLYVDDKAEDPNGSLSWKNGTLFVGNFSRGQRTGKGVIRFPTNVRYQGDFVRGKYDGFGTCTFQDGRVYTGQWKNGKAHGKGKLTEADGTVLHDGDWANDEPVLE